MEQDENSRRKFLKNTAFLVGSAFALNACVCSTSTAAFKNSAGSHVGETGENETKRNGPKKKTSPPPKI